VPVTIDEAATQFDVAVNPKLINVPLFAVTLLSVNEVTPELSHILIELIVISSKPSALYLQSSSINLCLCFAVLQTEPHLSHLLNASLPPCQRNPITNELANEAKSLPKVTPLLYL
jgi:hypothetical protein